MSKTLKEILALLTFVLMMGSPIALIVGAGYLYKEGYWGGGYWERRDSIYDPKLNQMRCLDENGDLSDDLEPPCIMLTGRGLKTFQRYKKSCEDSGLQVEWCRKEAWRRVSETRPKT